MAQAVSAYPPSEYLPIPFEHGHKLRKIEEFGEPGLRPVAGALRGQLNGGDGLPKVDAQASKCSSPFSFNVLYCRYFAWCTALPLCWKWGACGKYHAPASGQLVQVTAFHIEIAGFLCLRLGDTATLRIFENAARFLNIVGLIHKDRSMPSSSKVTTSSFAALVIEPFQLLLNGLFLGALHLLDGEPVPVIGLQLPNAIQDLPPLLQKIPLALPGPPDFLKLAVPDDDGVIVAGGDLAAQNRLRFLVSKPSGWHQNVGGGVELQILGRPLPLSDGSAPRTGFFLTQAQPLALLSGGFYHLKRLPSPPPCNCTASRVFPP